MTKELDILDNTENILRIKQQIYENLSMYGIEIACDIRTSRVSDGEAASYGLIEKVDLDKYNSSHPVDWKPIERFFRFSIKICSKDKVYAYAFTPGKILNDPTTGVRDFLWMSNVNKKISSFTDFLKDHKNL